MWQQILMGKNAYGKTQESDQKIVGYYHYIRSAFRHPSKTIKISS
jgi:hypothetical protein